MNENNQKKPRTLSQFLLELTSKITDMVINNAVNLAWLYLAASVLGVPLPGFTIPDMSGVEAGGKGRGVTEDVPLIMSYYDHEDQSRDENGVLINCMEPCDMMASGVMVYGMYGKAAACPKRLFDKRAIIHVPNVGDFQCLDRGGAIVESDSGIWIDLLMKKADFKRTGYVYGQRVEGWYWYLPEDRPTAVSQPSAPTGTYPLPYPKGVTVRQSYASESMHGYEYYLPGRDISGGAYSGDGEGTPLVAPMDGVVSFGYDKFCGPHGCYNSFVSIVGGNGDKFTILHLNISPDLVQNSLIKAGDSIGTEGDVGNSSEPHAHVAWSDKDGEYLDPYKNFFVK